MPDGNQKEPLSFRVGDGPFGLAAPSERRGRPGPVEAHAGISFRDRFQEGMGNMDHTLSGRGMRSHGYKRRFRFLCPPDAARII